MLDGTEAAALAAAASAVDPVLRCGGRSQPPRRSASLPGMVIGTLVLRLQVPESGSLKEKRQVVRSLVARVRRTFDVAIAEVGDQDLWQAVQLGVACVSNDARHADEVCQKVLNFVAADGEALLTDSRFEILRL